uniref:Polyketide synthase 32 n=1 Tax=Diaporthe helianthi TaxID=158607 RepID=A0A1C1X5V8_DIAHE|nr:polyketide synthase 32 [Diaporthe helianthi]
MPNERLEPIAIVGSGCHFAGGTDSPSALWKLLLNPRDVRTTVPESRFNAEGWYHPDGSYPGRCNVKKSYLLDRDVNSFDTEFFGMTPVEAKATDPQQRLLMETVYEAIEAAGMTLEDLRGSDTGVYVGVMWCDYESNLFRDLQTVPKYSVIGTGRSSMSSRLSYFFDWHGPSVTLDTACSSSLVALHLAVQALRAGDSRMAVACGTNVIVGPENYVTMSKLQLLSPDGLSRMWDRDANGYARGDGVTAVVLKTLSNALADGDHIECVIRGTDVNHDGATPGMTMPSASAQKALIRRTYTKAGLDPLTSRDQPHYFEAHGTGTPAGDGVEAEAIYRAFSEDRTDPEPRKSPLYVGSIKTVLGHTEGSAGIAGVLKASLAVQHGYIPPNLSFNNLSHRVEPFYKGVQILKTSAAWPDSVGSQPRRASVNSFGIGGTNAHAILESYNQPLGSHSRTDSDHLFTPLVFSAGSEHSLRASLSAYDAFLTNNPSINIHDLAWTLRKRRSIFDYRTPFVATSVADLQSRIRDHLSGSSSQVFRARPTWERSTTKVLGIFNGQGAQYARMGAELIEKSSTARNIVEKLEAYLSELPEGDRPTWSLKAELQAGVSESRVQEATMAQSLCTTVQILLVDLLRAAGITFSAVVGHSSGETAAAYAAGRITAREAIYVAFYRGIHVHSARSPNGDSVKGAMLAVGLPMETAAELCDDAKFSGRINVAASNSPSSVTISGDEDAISELKQVLDNGNIFNRRLFVDRAYHSRHMLPCFDGYVSSLHGRAFKPQAPTAGSCIWVSSVYDEIVTSVNELDGKYWAENLTRPVLFSQALATALSTDEFDFAVEVGPHPALKQPVLQTMQAKLGNKFEYTGTLSRGTDAVQAMSTCLGSLWSHLGSTAVNLDSYERFMRGGKDSQGCWQVVKGLPTYQWNHSSSYRHESRISRQMRLRSQPAHPLLGDVCPDSAPHQMSWRNILSESNLDWLSGHQVQGQTVFPASGYICTALAALVSLSNGRKMRLIEMRDFVIHHAIPLDTDVEVLTSLVGITALRPDLTQAKFTYSAALGAEATELTLAVSADIDILWGEADATIMPPRAPTPPHLVNVDPDRFYGVMDNLGLKFRGRFSSLTSIQRKHAHSSCSVKISPSESPSETFIHPAELDSAFQSIFPAYGYPGNDRLSSLHLPQRCELIRVSPSLCESLKTTTSRAPVVTTITQEDSEGNGFSGDINIYPKDVPYAAIQLQRMTVTPLRPVSAADDRKIFFKTRWIKSSPDALSVTCDSIIDQHKKDILEVLVRISTFYLRKIDSAVPSDHPSRSGSQHSNYLRYARHMAQLVENGKHNWAKTSWLSDELQDIMDASKPFLDRSDVRLMHLVGQEMPRALNGECDMLEVLRGSNLLDDYYENEFGLHQLASWIGRAASSIVDRHSHMKILEIDIDAVSSKHGHRVAFKLLDVEKDPVQQGYTEGSCDLIIAFSVLHATANLERTLSNARRLLKPGGFLLVGEANNSIQPGSLPGIIFGTLPGWWLGQDDGRVLSPLVSTEQWDSILKSSGFSGVDLTAPDEHQNFFGATMFLSQAIDDTVNFLRAPLAAVATPSILPPTDTVAIVGGQTARSACLVNEIKTILEAFATKVHVFGTLEDFVSHGVAPTSPLISLTELDNPIFKDMTATRFTALKKTFGVARDLLWITSGRRWQEPFSNMTVGFGRTARNEMPGLRLQFLDVEDVNNLDARKVAEIFLRLRIKAEENSHIMWPLEPEMVIDSDHCELVPRLRHTSTRNDRYNSTRRVVTHEVDAKSFPITMERSQDGCIFKELRLRGTDCHEPLVEIRTTHTILSAISTPLGHKFLVLGKEPSSGSTYLALVPSPASVLRVPETAAFRCSTTHSSMELLLPLVAAHLVATAVLHPLFPGQTVVVHKATSLIAHAIAAHAQIKDVHVVVMTDNESPGNQISCVNIASHSRGGLPANAASFVGFWYRNTANSPSQTALLSSLPRNCRVESADTIYSFEGCDHFSSEPILAHLLERAADYAEMRENHDQDAVLPSAAKLEDLANGTPPSDPMTVVDWASSSLLPVRVTSLDSGPMFRSDKTYWLAGLTGALGVSLCDWMVDHGARSIVLTSRSPQVDPGWISSHERNGVTITILPCDMNNEASLGSVKQTIDETLPPIAGVMNGAAVLQDVSIANMSLDQFNDVIGPKMYGSIYLDRLFWNEPLDFFILFSSVSCLFGNPGQANYCAANAYVCSLAAQRRKRGLAATALNIGAISGVGYMEREDRKALDLTVSKMALMRLSEEDVYQLIAEAIEAGRVDSEDGPELSTGLLDVQAESPTAPVWASDPRFSDFLVDRAESDDGAKQAVSESLSDMLKACESRQDLESIVKRAFATQLRKVSLVTMPDDELMAKRSNDLGLDSLVSVGIRDWFLKNFDVSIAVLKIIGNNTMASLAEDVAGHVPAELTPRLALETKA